MFSAVLHRERVGCCPLLEKRHSNEGQIPTKNIPYHVPGLSSCSKVTLLSFETLERDCNKIIQWLGIGIE